MNQVLLSWGWIEKPVGDLNNHLILGIRHRQCDVERSGMVGDYLSRSDRRINPVLYEAAQIDGQYDISYLAYYATSIKGTVIVVLILTIGSILGGTCRIQLRASFPYGQCQQ